MAKKLITLLIALIVLAGTLSSAFDSRQVEATYSLNSVTAVSRSEEAANQLVDVGPDRSDISRNGKTIAPHSPSYSWRSGEDTLGVTYYFPEPKIESSIVFDRALNYVTVTMDGLPHCEKTGLPVLPFRTAKILLPYGWQFKNIEAVGCVRKQLLGSYMVECGQEFLPLSTIESAVPRATFPNETVYDSSEPFPNGFFSDASIQTQMGYEILLVDLYPVEYSPREGKLFYYESIIVEAKLTHKVEIKSSIFKYYSSRREPIRSKVDNPEVIDTYPASYQTELYEYVIITNSELNNTPAPYDFQALIDDKISRGISAVIVTVEWIYANYNGIRPDGAEDNQTRIRNFIIDAYSNWGTKYVLLGGDGDGANVGGESGNAIIPHRGFASVSGEIDYDIPADMYYSCLDGTFDYDGNGKYGEPNDGPSGGEVDLFAEVYVGRACVDNQIEVENFVRKTLSYQSVAVSSEYLRKVWMVGERLGFGGVAEWGGNYKDEIKTGSDAHGYSTIGFENSPGGSESFDLSTLYDRDYPGQNWPKSEVIDVINDNAHLVNHLGHANVGKVMKMSNPDVDALTNDNLYFIGYSQGCYCGAFDGRTTTPGSYTNYDCIVEHLTTGTHGAVAFVANSRYGWGKYMSTDGPSQHYDREFWDAILGEGILNIGIANQNSKEDNAGRVSNWVDRWCYYEINLFGDPELRVKVPSLPEHELNVALKAPAYLAPGNSSLLNATVYNRGLNNEHLVTASLIINGTIVANRTISELPRNTSYTIEHLWTPAAKGVYNVTIFAPPAQGEDNTANNIKSANIIVTDEPVMLIVDDNDGSSSINGTSLHEFESSLMTAGYDYVVWDESSEGNPSLEFLRQFRLIIWTCGDFWNKAIDAVDAVTLESYLALGGSILLEGEDIGYTHWADDLMTNVAHAIYQVDNASAIGLTVSNADHPVTNGLQANFTWAISPRYADGVVPANTGMEVVKYTGTGWTAITTYEGSESKTVYFAFPLYCLPEDEGEILTMNSVNWLLKSPRPLDWIESSRVCNMPENKHSPSMATDGSGHLFVAYEHYSPSSGFFEIYVSKSPDQGITWSIIDIISDNHNLGNPSIAIDIGDNNNIFVAFERERTPNDHDIFVRRYVSGSWSTVAIANTLGNDDRYPSMTCEYQYGLADKQYISYEYAASFDNRDLMFADSADNGASWSVRKLHGEGTWWWPDYNVHCQTSITTARGSDGYDYVYIAYKWGADYATAYDIVIDKSKNRGLTWEQQWICDESSRNKNWPSIKATHGGGAVVIAWHVYWDSSYLNDIQYAFSISNGDHWHIGWLAWEANVNEETPTLTVDGEDSSNTFECGTIHLAYWRDGCIYYEQAPFNSPWAWTSEEKVSGNTAYASTAFTRPAIAVYRTSGGRYLSAITWTDFRNSSYDVYYSTESPARAHDMVYLESACDKLQYGSSWSKVFDSSSSSDLVMRASTSSSNDGCLYGPYIATGWDGVSMLGQPYIASFRLKISSNAFAGVVAYIDVGYDAGPTLQSRQIRASDFASSDTWQDFQLTFITPGSLTAGLEFRVVNYNNGITDLYADYITVSRGWGDSTVYLEGAYNKPQIAYGTPVSWSRFVDASSWSGIALKASASNASGSWLYGPYISSSLDGDNMRRKPYVASFRLKVLSNLQSSNVAYIDVSSSTLGSVLQSKAIMAGDFVAANVWQDFNLTFIVPDLLVSGIEFRVENLNNGVTDLHVDRIAVYRGWNASTVYVEAAYNKPKIAYGNPVSWSMLVDDSSWSGIVLKASASNASGSWLYGPYITETWDQMNIKGKPYTAVFTLKVSSRLPTNDVCYLDVCCGAGSTILKSARVKASDFAASNVWQDFKLSFIVPDPLTYGLEFRVMNLNGGITDLYIDKIELQKEWSDSTVYLEGAYNKPKIAYGNPVAWSQQIDSLSWSGIVLKAPVSSASGSWLYGPYITTGLDGQSLLGKSFIVAFRLEVSSNLRIDDVAYIDVCCEQGKVILNSTTIKASDFAASDSWQDFQLAFTVPSSLTYGLEFRMVNLNNNVTDLSVDIITIKAT